MAFLNLNGLTTQVQQIKKYVTARLGEYLPLSGGTVTGKITVEDDILLKGKISQYPFGIRVTSDKYRDYLTLGWFENEDDFSEKSGGRIEFESVDGTANADSFKIHTNGNSVYDPYYLRGMSDGSLTWGGNEVERVNSESLTHSGGYVRYENGLQICWSTITVNTQYAANAYATRTWTYPVAFKLEPVVFCNSRHDRFNVGTNNSPIGTASCTIYNTNTNASSAFTLNYIDCVAVGTWK